MKSKSILSSVIIEGLMIILSIAIILTVVPLSAKADEGETVFKNGTYFNTVIEDGYYKVDESTDWSFPDKWEKGTKDSYNLHWDKSKSKCTLNNITISLKEGDEFLYFDNGGGVTLELIGNNVITSYEVEVSAAINARTVDVTIMGSGSLEIRGESNVSHDGPGIVANNLTIIDNVTVTIYTHSGSSVMRPIFAYEKVNIFGTPTINAYATNILVEKDVSSAIASKKGFNIAGSPKMTITSFGHGFYTEKGMTNSIKLYEGGFIDFVSAQESKKAFCNINAEDVTGQFERGQSVTDFSVRIVGSGKAPSTATGNGEQIGSGSTGSGSTGSGLTDKDGISAGGVVGIVIGTLLVVSVGAYVAGYFLLYKNGKIANATLKTVFEVGDKLIEKIKKFIDELKNSKK